MQTLIGLMAVTGMRVGEAIGLDRDDVDARHQLVRVIDSKFGKSREVALHDTHDGRARRLRAAARPALSRARAATAFFVSRNGTRLLYQVVHRVFARLVSDRRARAALAGVPAAAARSATQLRGQHAA